MRSKGVLLLVMFHLFLSSVYGFGSYFGTTVTRGGSGVKIGSTERGAVSRGLGIGSGRGNSGIRIGEGRVHNSTRQKPIPTTSTTTTSHPFYTQPAETISHGDSHTDTHGDSGNITYLKVGLLVPYKSFGVREYSKAVTKATNMLQKSTRGPRLEMFQRYGIHVKVTMLGLTPSPTSVDKMKELMNLADYCY